MALGRFLTLAEQIAEHLRREIESGLRDETLPGLRHLAGELEVNFKTVSAALEILENEGVLVAQGAGGETPPHAGVIVENSRGPWRLRPSHKAIMLSRKQ